MPQNISSNKKYRSSEDLLIAQTISNNLFNLSNNSKIETIEPDFDLNERMMLQKRHFLLAILIITLLSSCSSTYYINHQGAARIKRYTFSHPDIPPHFNGYKIAFIADTHYTSTLQEQGLAYIVQQIKHLHPDLLLLGGDYVEQRKNIQPLFKALASTQPKDGIMGVMGNNDYERGLESFETIARRYHIELLQHRADTIIQQTDSIFIVGVRDPFNKKYQNISPDSMFSAQQFVLTVTHTPDYAEQGNCQQTDLFLAGHTHGGQVTLLGLYAPKTASAYGQKFRSGLNYSSKQIPVITTNGLGTSRRPIRFCAPSEIILITLSSK